MNSSWNNLATSTQRINYLEYQVPTSQLILQALVHSAAQGLHVYFCHYHKKINYFSLQLKHKLFKKYFQKDVIGAGMQSRREKMHTNSKNTLTSNLYIFRTFSRINFNRKYLTLCINKLLAENSFRILKSGIEDISKMSL